MKDQQIFPDVSLAESINHRDTLFEWGLLNPDYTVIGWTRLAPFLIERKLPQLVVKNLIQLEMEAVTPRRDMVRRMVSYVHYSVKEQTLETIDRLLSCQENQT